MTWVLWIVGVVVAIVIVVVAIVALLRWWMSTGEIPNIPGGRNGDRPDGEGRDDD